MNKFTYEEKRELEYLLSDLTHAIGKHCETDEDGDYIVLVGDENYNHSRIYVSQRLFKAMVKNFT